MAIKKLNPYLNFDGTAEQAIKLYERALGAKTENIMRFGDMPGGQATPPETKNRVMHAVLQLDGGTLMVSDTQPGMPLVAGSNVHVTVDFDDPVQMGRSFEALAAGGKVTMPLQDTFWGAKFGMVVDPFGISWMFNCENKKA
jgi:PhnB protein